MSRRSVTLVLVASLAGTLQACAGLPVLRPLPIPERQSAARRCLAPFPPDPFRVLHRIEAHLPLDNGAVMLGATVMDPPGRRFTSALVSTEGLTLLEAARLDADPTDRVFRAVPPLDRPGFAGGLLDDVELVLLPPRGPLFEIGRLPDDRLVCRFRGRGAEVIDVVPAAAGEFEVSRYDPQGRLLRKASARGPAESGLNRQIRIEAFGAGGYTLNLTLIEVEAVPSVAECFSP